LREVVESLFPAKVAARRAELEQQAAASKKRSVERVQQEGTATVDVFDMPA
jgi:hypothetical protein